MPLPPWPLGSPPPAPPQLRRLAFRVLTPGATAGVIAQEPPGLPSPPLILAHLTSNSVASGQPSISAVTALPVPNGSPARMAIHVQYPGESFIRVGAFALAYHPGMLQPAPNNPTWHNVWSDWNTSSLLLKKHGSQGLRITQVPVGWYDRLHTHPSEHRREGKRRPRYVAVARKARKAAKRQARYTARYGGKYLPVDPSLQAPKLRGYLPTSDLPPAIQARKLRRLNRLQRQRSSLAELGGSVPLRIPITATSGSASFTHSIDPKEGGPWAGHDPWALPGPGLPPMFRHRAAQGGQGPYDPLGIYASGGRRPGIYGQDEVPESDGPSLMYLGVAGALGWLVGRL